MVIAHQRALLRSMLRFACGMCRLSSLCGVSAMCRGERCGSVSDRRNTQHTRPASMVQQCGATAGLPVQRRYLKLMLIDMRVYCRTFVVGFVAVCVRVRCDARTSVLRRADKLRRLIMVFGSTTEEMCDKQTKNMNKFLNYITANS